VNECKEKSERERAFTLECPLVSQEGKVDREEQKRKYLTGKVKANA